MKTLVVDDQAPSALYLARALERRGHGVSVANDGLHAWRMIQERGVQLVASDWVMPNMDGIELCRKIRSWSFDSYIYIILMTTKDRREDRLQGLRAGADDFVVKPVELDELSIRLEIAGRILGVHHELAEKNARLSELATTDALTGARNRRRLQEDLEWQFSIARRHGLPLSFVLFDVDRFKSYNDAYGHPAGDHVLRELVSIVRPYVRVHDTLARYGGEEFALILPGTTLNEAFHIAERVRAAIDTHHWPHRPITASFGVAAASDATTDAPTLVDHADKALYVSKNAGRNRVSGDVLAELPTPEAPAATPSALVRAG